MCSQNDASILNSLPFLVYKKTYPILHILVGEFAEVFVHIFEQHHFIVIFQDRFQELNDFHRDVLEHYIATFVQLHYEFILDHAKEITQPEEADESFDLMKFFDITDIPEDVLNDVNEASDSNEVS